MLFRSYLPETYSEYRYDPESPERQLRCKTGHISVRLMYPLRWTEGLLEIMRALHTRQVPFQLEYADEHGVLHKLDDLTEYAEDREESYEFCCTAGL